jgi:hypothetical protein
MVQEQERETPEETSWYDHACAFADMKWRGGWRPSRASRSPKRSPW